MRPPVRAAGGALVGLGVIVAQVVAIATTPLWGPFWLIWKAWRERGVQTDTRVITLRKPPAS